MISADHDLNPESLSRSMNHHTKASGIDVLPTGSEWLRAVTADSIRKELCRANVVDSRSPIHLELVPNNPDRLDSDSKASFRVFRSGQPVCFLTVGRKLGGLWRRTMAFAEACPEIACRPLFYRRTRRWDVLGVEHFDGDDLESRSLRGEMSADEVAGAAARVLAALERTARPSHVEAAAREFDSFSSQVLASAMFGNLDRGVLRELIIPFIRAGALRHVERTRWTNGDFIARNILIDSAGNLRLIDMEFAARTHFFVDDSWRWRSYSRLPSGARDLSLGRDALPKDDWPEAYSILRQLLLSNAINSAHVAIADARSLFARLVDIVGAAHAAFRSSMFWGPARAATSTAPVGVGRDFAATQLFWSHDGSFREEHSQRIEFAPCDEALVRFLVPNVQGSLSLRLDPAEAVGLIRLSALRVRTVTPDQVVLSLNTSEDWDRLQLEAGLIRLVDSPDLNLLSLHNDPVLLLPRVDLGDSVHDLSVEVWLRFTRELSMLPSLSRTAQPAVALLCSRSDAGEIQTTGVEYTHEPSNVEQLRRTGESEEVTKSVLQAQVIIDEHLQALDAARRDLGARDHAIEDLRQKLAETSSDLDKRLTEITALNAQLAESGAQLSDSASACREFEEQAAAARAALGESERTLQTARSELDTRNLAIEQLRQALTESTIQLDARSAEATTLATQLRDIEEQLITTKTALDVSNRGLQAARSDLDARDQTIGKLAQTVADTTSQLAAARSDAASLRVRVAELENRLTAECTARRQADEVADSMRSVLTERSAHLAAAAREIANRDKTIAQLHQSAAEAAARLDALTAEAASTVTRISNLETALETERNSQDKATQEATELRVALKLQIAANESSRQEAAEREAELSALRGTVSDLRQSEAAALEKADQASKETIVLSTRVLELQAELQSQAAAHRVAMATEYRTREETERESAALRDALAQLREELETAKAALTAQAEHYSLLRQQTAACEAERDRLLAAVDAALSVQRSLQEEIDTQKTRIKAVDSDRNVLRQRLDELLQLRQTLGKSVPGRVFLLMQLLRRKPSDRS